MRAKEGMDRFPAKFLVLRKNGSGARGASRGHMRLNISHQDFFTPD